MKGFTSLYIMRRIHALVSASLVHAVLVSAIALTETSSSLAQGQKSLSSPHVSDLSDDALTHNKELLSRTRQEASFPRPLGVNDAQIYKTAFQLVRCGRVQRALQPLESMDNSILVGDIQAEAYLRAGEHPSAEQLSAWIEKNTNSPDAPAIKLTWKRLSAANENVQELDPILPLDDVRSSFDNGSMALAEKSINRNPRIDRAVQENASHGVAGAIQAVHIIDTTPGISFDYAGQLYGDVALVLLTRGETQAAYKIGTSGFDKGKKRIGAPAFIAGLAAWHEQRFSDAYSFFSAAANAPIIDSEQKAAASFWAARTAKPAQAPYSYVVWLRRAAIHAESLYGLLAAKQLEDVNHEHSSLSGMLSTVGLHGARSFVARADIDAVMSMKEGHHLFSLLQIGEQGRAEILARHMWKDVIFDPMRAHSLQLIVQSAGMYALSVQMSHLLEKVEFQGLKESVDPLPVLKPKNGFKLHPSLVYAVARMESNFNGDALSPAGAYGIMQIRPQTAGYIAAVYIDHVQRNPAAISVPADMTQRLKDVSYNLEVGQLYMKYLAVSVAKGKGNKAIAGQADLLRVLASYNAGPQAIIRWENNQKNLSKDPLYYIETLPSAETRQYVHNVLKTTWLYAHRMKHAAPSLKSLSKGEWPSFGREEVVQDSPS